MHLVIQCNQWTETGSSCDSLFKQQTPPIRCQRVGSGAEREDSRDHLQEQNSSWEYFPLYQISYSLQPGKKASERGLLGSNMNTLRDSLSTSFHVPDSTYGVTCLLFLWLRQQEQFWLQKNRRLRGWRLSLRICYSFPKMCSHTLRVLSLPYGTIKGREKSDYGGGEQSLRNWRDWEGPCKKREKPYNCRVQVESKFFFLFSCFLFSYLNLPPHFNKPAILAIC